MKNLIKKLVSTVVLSILCITTLVPTSAFASEVSTEIGVTAAATLLDVTITPSVAVTIDPVTGASVPGAILITNNTLAPVKVTLASLTAAGGSAFNLVAPDAYADWKVLNKTQSQDIALMLSTGNGWKTKSSNSFSSGSDTAFTGTIAPAPLNNKAYIAITQVYHGRAFADVKTATFDLDFVIELE